MDKITLAKQLQIEEMEKGYAEGIDGAEIRLQNILRDLATLYFRVSNLEDMVEVRVAQIENRLKALEKKDG